MAFLNDAINAALREHNIPQVGTSGSASLADAVRSLLAPKGHQAGLSAEDTHAETDAIQEHRVILPYCARHAIKPTAVPVPCTPDRHHRTCAQGSAPREQP